MFSNRFSEIEDSVGRLRNCFARSALQDLQNAATAVSARLVSSFDQLINRMEDKMAALFKPIRYKI